jgi:hypothetical protein
MLINVPHSSSNSQALENGGLAGLFWTYVWTFIGFCFVIASLAEMASMCVLALYFSNEDVYSIQLAGPLHPVGSTTGCLSLLAHIGNGS